MKDMLMKLRALITIFVFLAMTPGLGSAQEGVPLPEPGPLEKELDYSYCRFDSLTTELVKLYIPPPIQAILAGLDMHPRFLPLYVTAIDANLDDPGGQVKHKFIYTVDGKELGAVTLLEVDAEGTWARVWQTQDVPPAGHVKLRMYDLNRDTRMDLIATARGGLPSLEALNAFSFIDSTAKSLIQTPRGVQDPNSTIGIAIGVFDTLGQNGYPAIEVWKDDQRPATGLFVHVVHQYSDSLHVFVPAAIDTLPFLPRWCRGRRAAGAGE